MSLKAQNGETPLHLASRHGHVSLAQILLGHGATANETSLEGKQTVVAGTELDALTCLPRQWMTIAYYGRTVWGLTHEHIATYVTSCSVTVHV